MAQRTVDLSAYRDLDIRSITMRTVNGEDSMDAAARALPMEGDVVDGNIFGLGMRQQQIANAIIGWTDKDNIPRTAVGPAIESIRWSARTREYVGEVYDYMNGMSYEERKDFRAALAGSAPLVNSAAK